MEKDLEKTRVVFRRWKDTGNVIALFPCMSFSPGCCGSYEHVGQHGGAHYTHVIRATVPTTDYDGLDKELESIGYNLDIVSRSTSS